MHRLNSAKRKTRLNGRSHETLPTGPLETWFDPVPAVLTGVRTALAVGVTAAIWVVTAWPSGPIAVIVAASVCSLIASMEQPVTISLALATTILLATVPVFVTLFYLLPRASDFVSMAFALAPLLLMCGFVMAQPKIGPMGQLTAVYFTVGSNIDNIMNYDTVRFLNTAFAISVRYRRRLGALCHGFSRISVANLAPSLQATSLSP